MELSSTALRRRAAFHAALGDPHRLGIVELLHQSDLTPTELARRLGIDSNLFAHHVRILKSAGLVHEVHSAADGRRRYLQLVPESPLEIGAAAPRSVLFVCTQNSARSQLAAALFKRARGGVAESAGTHPALEIHPLARVIARRHRLLLSGAPQRLDSVTLRPELLVTVCDQANEELRETALPRLHWSIPDPAKRGTVAAFESAYETLSERVQRLVAA